MFRRERASFVRYVRLNIVWCSHSSHPGRSYKPIRIRSRVNAISLTLDHGVYLSLKHGLTALAGFNLSCERRPYALYSRCSIHSGLFSRILDASWLSFLTAHVSIVILFIIVSIANGVFQCFEE
jgi:hypothetical protein